MIRYELNKDVWEKLSKRDLYGQDRFCQTRTYEK
jgi:hypothetical protein